METKQRSKAFFSFMVGLVSSSATGVFCRMIENGLIRASIRITGDIGPKSNKPEKTERRRMRVYEGRGANRLSIKKSHNR